MTTKLPSLPLRPQVAFPPPIMIDRNLATPLHQQIYGWYQAAIADGRLGPGQAVPSTRSLAKQLAVSRAPVLAAFDQLMAEGYFEAAIGSGTRVSRSIPISPKFQRSPLLQNGDRPIAKAQVSQRALSLVAKNEPWLSSPGAFRASLPALDQFPVRDWSALVARHSRNRSPAVMGYGSPMGYEPLREAIAHYLGAARGVRCTAEQVMIVSGSQQGLQIAARALLDEGDQLLMEDPGYPGAQAAFASAAVSLVPVPVDREGLDIGEGVRRAAGARAAYVTPSHQYPLGVSMSATRRMELLAWARERDAWIIEDDYDSEFRFDARPMPALQGLDAADRVIYIGTFSKVLFPALRVGYVVIPNAALASFQAVREAIDICPPTPTQAALGEFVGDGSFARHLRRMRLLYEERRSHLSQSIAKDLHAQLRVVGIEAGMFLTVLLRGSHDDVAIALGASAQGVSAIPLSTCFLGACPTPGLILGYGNAAPDEMDRGIKVLKSLV